MFADWIRGVAAALLGAAMAVAPAFAQKCEDPKVLKFSLVPTQDSVRELGYYKPILDQLSKNTGKKIEFYMPTSYSSVVEALMGKWVDVAVLGPEAYVIARKQGHFWKVTEKVFSEELRPGPLRDHVNNPSAG